MVLLFGAAGYVGSAFAAELGARGIPFTGVTRGDARFDSTDSVAALVDRVRPEFAINAIGYPGRPNVDATEREKLRCLAANTVVPGVIAEVLAVRGIPWGHVSSGCIFQGTRPDGSGFTEDDAPNFAFGDAAASWYSRTKAMAESLLRDAPDCLIWRLRIPFDEFDHERNYLTKAMEYDRLLEVRNSISHRGEFAAACVETLVRRLPAGIYNVTNPGAVWTSDVVAALARRGMRKKPESYFSDEGDFLSAPGRIKRASCLLDGSKLEAAGIRMREVHEAIEWSLENWHWRTG